MSVVDYYRVLGITRSATSAEIRSAYRSLARKHYPKEASPSSEFEVISESYDVLSNDLLRSLYDHYGYLTLHSGLTTPSGENIPPYSFSSRPYSSLKMFEMTFGHSSPPTEDLNGPISLLTNTSKGQQSHRIGAFPSDRKESKSSASAPPKCPPLHVNLYCGLDDFWKGNRKALKVHFLSNGQFAEKYLNVDVERWWCGGMEVVVGGEGNEEKEKENGDVHIHIVDKPHPTFEREGKDCLKYRHRLSLCEALCGCTMEITLLDGRILPLGYHEVIEPTTRKVVGGEGFEREEGGRGDLIIEFDVEFPSELSNEQKEKVRIALEGK